MHIIELDIDSGGSNFYNYCFFFAILFSDWYFNEFRFRHKALLKTYAIHYKTCRIIVIRYIVVNYISLLGLV
jgi:hypothetical protein